MHALLIGNGLNRLSLGLDWTALINQLAVDIGVAHRMQRIDGKPLSLVFEELCAHSSGSTFRSVEMRVKRQISLLAGRARVTELHRRFVNAFEVILTTNYDDTLEQALGWPLFESSCFFPESRYSLFRRCKAGGKELWHIHGESAKPESILLGYDHYAGYLQKIRNYLTDELRQKKTGEVIRSPLKGGAQAFEHWGWKYSWVDHFLRDHLHIVGFGIDFTEIDIWWLLLHKRRRRNITGHTFYYEVVRPGSESAISPQLSVLESLGVRTHRISAATYEAGYAAILDRISVNVAAFPALLDRPSSIDETEGKERPGTDQSASQLSLLISDRASGRRRPR